MDQNKSALISNRSVHTMVPQRTASTLKTPDLLAVTADNLIITSAQIAAGTRWNLEVVDHIPSPLWFIERPNIAVLVVDGDVLDLEQREMTLSDLRIRAYQASLIYIAGKHTDRGEVSARSLGLDYYTAKPIEIDKFSNTLTSFLKHRTSPFSEPLAVL